MSLGAPWLRHKFHLSVFCGANGAGRRRRSRRRGYWALSRVTENGTDQQYMGPLLFSVSPAGILCGPIAEQ